MKKLLYILLACVLTASCDPGEDDNNNGNGTYDRTVLIYMAMQNSLGSARYHKADSVEIVQAMEFIPGNAQLLLFIDDAERPRLYELNRDWASINKKTGKPFGPLDIKRWSSDVSSVSPSTLTEVLNYMRQNYKSDSYGLVMGSHATGWLPREYSTDNYSQRRTAPKKTFGIDVGKGGSMSKDRGPGNTVPDQMEITDLANAISKSGIHLDYILFDACLMQNIEVDYALRQVTDYVIASPISISAEGAYYTDLVHYGLFSKEVTNVGRAYVDYYLGMGSIPYADGYGTVLSCVKTAGLEQLATTVRTLINQLTNGGTPAQKVEILKQTNMNGALNYHTYANNYYYRPHNYDLISAFITLGANEQQLATLRTAMANVVTYKGATPSFWIGPGYNTFKAIPKNSNEWCGVSIFIPQQIYTSNAGECVFGDLNEAYKRTEWYKKVF